MFGKSQTMLIEYRRSFSLKTFELSCTKKTCFTGQHIRLIWIFSTHDELNKLVDNIQNTQNIFLL